MIDKPDGNRRAILAAVREQGWSADVIRGVGRRRGLPDLLVGAGGFTFLVEVKPSPAAELKPSQIEWRSRWRGGRVVVAWDPDQLVRFIGEQIADQLLRRRRVA